jgi:glycosyltransferase involved in cell wall biosynthesis
MNILQLVPYFYPAWAYGGPAKLVYDTSVYFSTHGDNVTVYTSDSYDKLHRMPDDKRIKDTPHFRVRYFRNIHNSLAYTYNIFFTPGLYFRALFEISSFDIIHIHDFYTPQNVWIGLLARMFHKPYILSVHGCLEEKRVAQRSTFKRVFLQLFGVSLLHHADKVVATSENEVQAYNAYGVEKSRIMLLGHGVTAAEFETTLARSTCKKEFGFAAKDIVVTYLGRLHKIKGLDLLVDAISRCKDPRVKFVIAGSDDGYLLELIKQIRERKISKRVTLLGTCFGEQKARLFKATDIFVYPSYSEGFSLGILEAGAAGLPLVITTGCHFEEVRTHQAGIIVEPSGNALFLAIMRLVSHPELRLKCSGNVHSLIQARYSTEKIGQSLRRMYASVLQQEK